MEETKEAIHNSHMDCVGVKCFSPRLSCDLFRLMRNASFIFKSIMLIRTERSLLRM